MALSFVYLPSSFADFANVTGTDMEGAAGDPRWIASVAVVIGIVMAAGILALTGYNEGPEAERALASGCDGLLGKPICSEVLRARVSQVLAQAPCGARV